MFRIALSILALLLCPLCQAQSPEIAGQLKRAGSLLAAGKTEEAIRIYSDIVGRYPGEPLPRVNLAIAQYRAGLYREAADSARKALELNPGLPAAYLFLGASLLTLDQPADAVDPLTKALAALPSDRNARLMLAEAKLALKDFAEAAAHFEAVSSTLLQNPRVWYGLAKSYEGLGRSQDAAQAAEKLRALPPSVQSHRLTAEDLDRRGLRMQAAEAWRGAAKLAPDDAQIQVKFAWSLYRARDYASAAPLIETLSARLPQSPEISFLRGACLLNMADPRAAVPHLEAALRKDPALLPARAALGQALVQIGEPARAIPHLEAALATDEDGAYHYQIARAYMMTGQHDLARKALAEYEQRQKQR